MSDIQPLSWPEGWAGQAPGVPTRRRRLDARGAPAHSNHDVALAPGRLSARVEATHRTRSWRLYRVAVDDTR